MSPVPRPATLPVLQFALNGGRSWWAHLRLTRINIELTIQEKKIEETPLLRISAGNLNLRAFQGDAEKGSVLWAPPGAGCRRFQTSGPPSKASHTASSARGPVQSETRSPMAGSARRTRIHAHSLEGRAIANGLSAFLHKSDADAQQMLLEQPMRCSYGVKIPLTNTAETQAEASCSGSGNDLYLLGAPPRWTSSRCLSTWTARGARRGSS